MHIIAGFAGFGLTCCICKNFGFNDTEDSNGERESLDFIFCHIIDVTEPNERDGHFPRRILNGGREAADFVGAET